MFRPAIQSLRVLLFMALFCSTMVFISIYFTTEDIKDGYEYKIGVIPVNDNGPQKEPLKYISEIKLVILSCNSVAQIRTQICTYIHFRQSNFQIGPQL